MPKKWLTALKNLFFPLLCLSCGRKIRETYLCLNCQSKIKFLGRPNCYSQIDAGRLIKRKTLAEGKKEKGLKTISTCAYSGPIKDLIHQFKYKHCSYLAEFISQLMAKQLKTIGFNPEKYDFMVFVPLSSYKIKTRGYNQAELLAKYLANYFKLQLKSDIINSAYLKDSQTKLSLEKRKENVKGKFKVKKDIKNRNIVLVDDVLTTGATLFSCWEALKEKGANNIDAVTLAK